MGALGRRYCGSHGPLNIDHVVPRCKGGTHDEANLVTSCFKCNMTLLLPRQVCFRKASLEGDVIMRCGFRPIPWLQAQA
jgi:HNH endonuclease